MYYTYVLLSKSDNQHYIGYTENISERVNQHNNGLVTATKNRRPLELIYYECCLNKLQALKREKYFKTGFGRRYLKNRI